MSQESSVFSPLSDKVFRMLWFAWLAANLTMWMNDVAAAWLMSQLTTNATMVALVQAASTLPVFLLGLPSGALADIVDRRRFLAFTQLWIAIVAAGLAVLSLTGLLTPGLLLTLTFANGIGLAMRWPVFSAIIPEVVPREQLPSALVLNALSMNGARVVGPILAGAILATVNSAAVFFLNAFLSASAFVLILRWRYQPQRSALPGERLISAMRVGIQFAWRSQSLRALLLRAAIFFMQCTALIALLPLVARRFGGDANTYTLLLAALGAGAVLAGVLLPRVRKRASYEQLIGGGSLLYALMSVLVAYAPNIWVAVVGMAGAGMAWIVAANSIMVSAQLVLPNWVRARGMALMQVSVMGGTAAGAALWGIIATQSSVAFSVAISGVLALFLLLIMVLFRVKPHDEDEVRALPVEDVLKPVLDVQATDGPVLVSIDYRVDPEEHESFMQIMQATRIARLRLGTRSWRLYRDSSDPTLFVECFIDENWTEHLRRLERFSVADRKLREQRLAFRCDNSPRTVRRLVGYS